MTLEGDEANIYPWSLLVRSQSKALIAWRHFVYKTRNLKKGVRRLGNCQKLYTIISRNSNIIHIKIRREKIGNLSETLYYRDMLGIKVQELHFHILMAYSDYSALKSFVSRKYMGRLASDLPPVPML